MGTRHQLRHPSIALILLVVITNLVVAGCGVGGASTSPTTPPTTTTDVNIIPTTLDFGVVPTGTKKSLNLGVTNPTTDPITVKKIDITDPAFTVSGISTGTTILASQTVTAKVDYAPTTTTSTSSSVTITTSNSNGNGKKIGLLGKGGTSKLDASPTALAFGTVDVGQTTSQSTTIMNSGTASLNITAVNVNNTSFAVSGVTLPLTLAAGASKAITVNCSPKSTGSLSGVVSFTSDANSGSSSISLSATGATTPVGTLSLSASSLAFGNQLVNTSATKTVTLTNSGTATLNISAITGATSTFAITGLTLPLALNAGASATATITFAPKATGATSATIGFTNDGSAAPTLSLSGTGVAPQLSITPTSIAFGNVVTGTTSSQQLTLKNTGTANLSVSQLTAAGSGFAASGFTLPLTLAPGASAVGNVTFAPAAAGSVTGSVTASSDSLAAVAPVALSGTGVTPSPQISVTPTSIAFGNVTTGSSSSQPLSLKNTGTANLSVTAITPSGAGYTVNGFILPLTLTPGTTATGNVVFAPAATGSVNGSVAIASNSSTAAPTVSLTGSGVAPATYQLSASPSSLSFGNVIVGNTGSLAITLTNTGTGSVSVSAANVTGTGYSVSGTYPMTIAAGATKTVNMIFAPQVSGAANGSVSFVSNATNSPATVTATANAQAPQPHSVDLTWNASTSAVAGYNVYRGSVTGGPYTLLTSSPIVGTSFTDSAVSAGTSYYYVVTAVDSSNVESLNSNEAIATVPSP